ncbi:MAG: TlpA disulfide reductase family protein [Thermodesulfobacteriota bacterium]|jgi:thiol-disulfide isomerase/thioredoxin
MNKNNTKLLFLLLIGFVFLLSGLFSKGIEAAGTSEESIKPDIDNNKKISALELPIPQIDQDKAYLGLKGTGTFKLTQIKTRVLIIEILDFYCPHCQHDAPLVNDFYRNIQERADIKDKIKVIGIGVGNSPYELNLFKQKFQVTFPLLPDQDSDISKTFGVKGTPTFIGIKLNDQGLLEKFFLQEGGFEEAPKFLKELINKSGLK